MKVEIDKEYISIPINKIIKMPHAAINKQWY